MAQDLVVLGAGGFARQLPSLVTDVNFAQPRYRLLGFLAPDNFAHEGELPILGTDSELSRIDAAFVIGIGIPHLRASVDHFATSIGRYPATLIHPQASSEQNVRMGPGCIVLPGVRLQIGTILGRHVLANANAVVGHDCEVGDHTVLSPLSMLAGHVRIGARVLIGAGAVVLPGRVIGDDAVVGAGAVVTTDVPAGTCVVGVPARATNARDHSSAAANRAAT